jgi:hypothetical protein
MTYIVNLNSVLYGAYETIDLVRTNLMIILIYNLERRNLSVDKYENIHDYLSVPRFSEESLHIPELREYLSGLGIHIERVELERNGKCALEKIMNHINWRFMELDKKMAHDDRVKITFPGDNSRDHQLGVPYRSDWKLIDRHNWEKLSGTLHTYIGSKIKELEKKHHSSQSEEKKDKRIRFGEVLYDNATPHHIQVWSANGINWNLPKGTEIPGLYQAEQMRFQEPGVFGMVVTPKYGYHNLVPESYD